MNKEAQNYGFNLKRMITTTDKRTSKKNLTNNHPELFDKKNPRIRFEIHKNHPTDSEKHFLISENRFLERIFLILN